MCVYRLRCLFDLFKDFLLISNLQFLKNTHTHIHISQWCHMWRANRGRSTNTFHPPPPGVCPTGGCVLSPLRCALWGGEATGRGWDVFQCINQCHAFRRVLFDVKQTRWECRPCCEKRADVLMEKQHPPGICKWRACICLRTPLSCQGGVRLWNVERKDLAADWVYINKPQLV